MNSFSQELGRVNSKKKTIQVLGAALGLLLFCLPVFSQLNLGRIFGGVTDQSGGAVAGATVTVLDVARGIARPLVSDGAGEYSAPSLTPGTYTVRAEAKGFKIEERTDIVVGVGQDVRVDLTLQPGEQTQTITVTGELPVINTANAELGGTVSNTTVTETPLNGREYTFLLNYQPGVQQVPGGSGVNGFYSNGNRNNANVFLFDGLNDNNRFNANGPDIGGGGPGVDQGTVLPLDAVQEIDIVENPKADMGWKTGAQANVGLKSGTNTLHGSAFGFLRNKALDAKNPFLLPTQSKEVDDLKQYGGSIGGPIKKDKIFYFGSYEGQNVDVGEPKILTVPTTASGGSLTASNSFPAAIAAMETAGYCNPAAVGCTNPISQLSLNLAGCTLPTGLTGAATCNAANGVFGNSTNSSQVSAGQPVSGSSNNGIVKIDYHFSDKNAFNAEYFYGQGSFLGGGAIVQPYWRPGLYTRTQAVRAVEIWTPNSNWVNEMRFGIDRQNFPGYVAECNGPNYQPPGVISGPNYSTQFGLVTGAPVCGFPVVTINTFTGLGASTVFQTNVSTTFQGLDSISYTHGKHQFKFGVDIEGNFWNGASVQSVAKGAVVFGTTNGAGLTTPLEDFLAGVATLGTATATRVPTSVASLARNTTWNNYALYAQDDWRLTPRITANLGIRWEKQTPITANPNLLGNFVPSAPTGLVQAGIGGQGSELYSTTDREFGPRFGIAWDVTGKGTTVVHAGLSVLFEALPAINLLSTPQGAQLNGIPTGFGLFAANGTQIPSPGTIVGGTILPSSIGWAVNTPLFNISPSGLKCGDGLGSVAMGSPTGPANPQNPGPCLIAGITPHLGGGYLTTWTLGVQHAFTNNLSLNIAYVGNHGTHLPDQTDINQPLPGTKNTGTAPGSGNEQVRRPYFNQFPYIGTIYYEGNGAVENYDALQAALTQRVAHGLTFIAGYTFAHSFDEMPGEQTSFYMDNEDPHLDYGNGVQDVRNHFTLTGTYLVPGRKSPGQILEGWQVNSAVVMQSPLPFSAADSTDDLSGTGENLDRWTMLGPGSSFKVGPTALPCFGVPGSSFGKSPCTTVAAGTGAAGSATFVQNLPAACIAAASAEETNPNVPAGTANATGLASLASFGCYYENGSAIVAPAQGTYGTMPRDVLRGKPVYEWDLGAAKNWKFHERYGIQFRAEFFNLLNRTSYALPATNPSAPSTFGVLVSTLNSSPVIGSGSPREIQLALRFTF